MRLQAGGIELWWVIVLLMLIPSLFIYCTSHTSRAPKYARFFVFQAFAMSILWIWFVANILVDMLQLLGYISGIAPTYLALTVLSFGNAVGDAMADLAISKMGFGELAITGCVAGPLFNLLVGLGLSLTKLTAEYGTIPFSILHAPNLLPLASLAFLLATLLGVTGLVLCSHFELHRCIGWLPLACTCLFVVLTSALNFVI